MSLQIAEINTKYDLLILLESSVIALLFDALYWSKTEVTHYEKGKMQML